MIWSALFACQPQGTVREPRGGIALGLFADDAAYDYGQLIDEIAETGASDLLLAVPWILPDRDSHALRAGSPRTALTASLRHASQLGLQVTVMPILTLEDRLDGVWRGDVDPPDRERFWNNYQGLLRTVAVDAERGGAVRLVIGSELNALEQDPAWIALAQDARSRFSGRISYSANWDRYAAVRFWHAVDEVSVTAYFPVVDDDTWPSELAALHRYAASQDRPLVITEYGYPALETAAQRPWDETTGAAPAPALQAQLITGALAAIQCHPPDAHFLWNWFGTGNRDEASFTPRNRPAADVVYNAYSSPSCPGTRR